MGEAVETSAERERVAPSAPRAASRSGRARVIGQLALLLLAGALPIVVRDDYVVSLGMQVEVMMSLALGLNIVVGYAGLLDLGFAAFFAIGAYTTGLLALSLHWPVLATLPVSILMALAGAVVVGTPTLRLRRDYLAVVTLGFGEVVQLVVNNLDQTGGPTGLFGIPPLEIAGYRFVTPSANYYVFFFILVVFIAASVRLRSSGLGRAWLAIREDEDVAMAMGIKTQRNKLYAYMAGAVIGGITGSLYGPAMVGVAPPTFGFMQSLLIVMAVSIGGMGSVPGALIGAAVVIAGPEVLRTFSQARLLVFGLVLVAMMMARPQGVWPEGGPGVGRVVAGVRLRIGRFRGAGASADSPR
ncbi:MAG TPA: branched-chain amino acid ABC transporter permease [Candidatus Limnocylindrales bacterium]